MEIVERFGVIGSITWNSNRWQSLPTQEDIANSNYENVRINGRTQDCLNFAHENLPLEDGGVFKGYSSSFNRNQPTGERGKNIKILFLISTKYGIDSGRKVVGIYGFPKITKKETRKSRHDLFDAINHVNLEAKPEDIVLLDNYLPISNFTAWERGFLPLDIQISDQGFNYLNSDNVQNLLDYALSENPNNEPLKRLIGNLELKLSVHSEYASDKSDKIAEKKADSLAGIAALENELLHQVPNKRQRLSTFIERGGIANKVKKITDYTCLVCQALGMEKAKGFKKDKDGFYIEAHHVIPVSQREKGSLSATNIITVCPTHHRQFHYGRVTVLENTADLFRFNFDGVEITIPKIKITSPKNT